MSKRDRDHDDGRDRSSSYKRQDRHGGMDEPPVSTLHVSGLPGDARSRELKNLCAFLPGFEGAVLRQAGVDRNGVESCIGFIKFGNQAAAMMAMQSLNGYMFDEEQPDRLVRCSLAKRDMNVRSGGGNRTPAPYYPPAAYGYGMGMGGYGMDPYGGGGYGGMEPQGRMGGGGGYGGMGGGMGMGGGAPQQESFTITSTTRGAACDTLCLRGLTPYTSDEDLTPLLRRQPGYSEMKLYRDKGLAFARFEKVEDASAALTELTDKTVMLPGTTGRMSVLVEYARRSLNSSGSQ